MKSEVENPELIAQNVFPNATPVELSLLVTIIIFRAEGRNVASLLRDPRLKNLDTAKLQNFASTRY